MEGFAPPTRGYLAGEAAALAGFFPLVHNARQRASACSAPSSRAWSRDVPVTTSDPNKSQRGLHCNRSPQITEPIPKPVLALRACLSVRFQGLTPLPQYRPSASSRLWPARPAALCLPDHCGLGSDSHGGEVFSGKLLEFLTQTGSETGPPTTASGPFHFTALLLSAKTHP